MNQTIALSLDLKGLSCPLPIVKTAKAIKELASGEVIEVFATDPGAVPDFAAWCRSTGHTLVESTLEGGVYRFVVRKR
jgi:tRNA 2-thiouridine synthesizing protein A